MKLTCFKTLALLATLALPLPAIAQDAPAQEPSLDDLLDIGDGNDPGQPDPGNDGDDKPDDPDQPAPGDREGDNPELTRELDRRLSGQQAAEQFEQAIQEMDEVASRLAEDRDPGIDTQRMQEEIILKLEQIISSAQPSQQHQSSSSSGQSQGEAREADKPGQAQQPGDPQAQQPGEQPGEQPGQDPGEGQQPGQEEKPGNQPGEQPNGQESGDGQPQRGDVRNAELSMEELREGEWGNLPPRLRDELAESLSEEFNPVYRSATEEFYRRIAELSKQEAESER